MLKQFNNIQQNSQDVLIKKEALDAVADQILHQMTIVKYSTSTWRTHDLHPKDQTESTIDWIFLVDLLNFSFWSDSSDPAEMHTVTYKGQAYTGYWTLCACINRGI